MQSTFGTDPADIIHISAKTGKGVEDVLKAIIERIPPPSGSTTVPLKAFLFDSLYTTPFLPVRTYMFTCNPTDTTGIEVSFHWSLFRTESSRKVVHSNAMRSTL
jgi:translation elongation factor EF-4